MSVAVGSALSPETPDQDVPRPIVSRAAPADRLFRGVLRSAGVAVLAMTGAILLFLVLRSSSAFAAEGWRFFTTSSLVYSTNQFGIAALLPDTILIAVIALAIAVPAGIAAALFISEYAPQALRRVLVAIIDLLAATPSIVFALWGLFFLMPAILGTDSWLARHASFFPLFQFHKPYDPQSFVGSTFISGVVVSLMVIPIITSLSRQVFSQAPQGEREAAYALGATRWGMVRTVVLPFGRAGMIGASMLGLGRALGETIAVSFILTPNLGFDYRTLESGGNSITAEIANNIFDTDPKGISFLFAAALVLFAMTLVLNTLASIVINRSRSGASTTAD
jgi:phosphate transport system permease protein